MGMSIISVFNIIDNKIDCVKVQVLVKCNKDQTRSKVQIPLESIVFLLTLAVLENHEIFHSCFSEDDSEIELKYCKCVKLS